MRTCHSDAPSKAIGLKLGPSLHLQVYFVYASSEGSGESVPSLVAGAISTEVSCTGLKFLLTCNTQHLERGVHVPYSQNNIRCTNYQCHAEDIYLMNVC